MPRLAASGTKGLYKSHDCARRPADPTTCDCAWRGRHFKDGSPYSEVLAKWAGHDVDPRSKKAALVVLGRFKAAVDGDTYTKGRERPTAKGGEVTLKAFAKPARKVDGTWEPGGEWVTDYAEPQHLAMRGLASTLRRITEGPLGALTLKQLAGDSGPDDVSRWLNEEGRARTWTNKTWNSYHEVLTRVFKYAVAHRRMKASPMPAIKRRVAVQPELFKVRHLVEDVEDRLFEVVDQLNKPAPRSTRGKLTEKSAAAIRRALATGMLGKDVAAKFKVSPAVVSAIKHERIWRDREVAVGTKGTEMRRRLIGAFDGGLRAGEMMRITLAMVNWRKVSFIDDDGHKVEGYVITLPPSITKGGKRTGKSQEVFAGTPRFVQMLERRRFQLQGAPAHRQFIFGTEAGRYQGEFKKMAQALYALAGLTWGRKEGLVWHTTRHEFISRISERNQGNQKLVMDVARLGDAKTAALYTHTRDERRYAAAAGVGRR